MRVKTFTVNKEFIMRRFIKQFLISSAAGVLIFSALSLLAHEGEDHGIKLPAPAQENRFVVATATENFEVVVKYDPIAPGDSVTLDLFLNDFATNRPTLEAEFEVEVEDSLQIDAMVEATEIPGIYRLKASFPEAKSYDLVLTISAADQFDLVPVSGIEVGKELAVVEEASGHSSFWQWSASALGAIMIGFVSFNFGKRQGMQNNNSSD
jgi:hypothetical protein